MGSLRTKETDEKYKKHIAEGKLNDGCNLCKAPSIIEFESLRIIDNSFPYDKIATTHHMVISKAHKNEESLSDTEKAELTKLKKGYLNENYEWLFEPLPKKKSIPEHFHLHLIVGKD